MAKKKLLMLLPNGALAQQFFYVRSILKRELEFQHFCDGEILR
jgi:hypothetical protein